MQFSRRIGWIVATIGLGFAAAGCGESETKPLDTKDLPETMVTKPGDETPPPSGNQFKNPRDAAGASGRPTPQGR